MQKLAQLRQAVSAYFVAPRKDQPQPPRPNSKAKSKSQPQRPIKKHLDRRSMSPTNKTYNWLLNTITPAKGPEHRVRRGRVKKTPLPSPSSSRKSSGARTWFGTRNPVEPEQSNASLEVIEEESTLVAGEKEEGQAETVLEGSTLVVGHRSDNSSEYEGSVEPEKSLLDLESEKKKRQNTLKEIAKGDWGKAEITLYRRMVMRGFEPLLPRHWTMDFRTIPGVLFGTQKQSFINSASGKDFRAQRALRDLLSLGANVRAKLESGLAPEPLIKREIQRYIKWSEEDGQYAKKDFLPVISIATTTAHTRTLPSRTAATALEASMLRKLAALAAQHRARLAIWPSIESSAVPDVAAPPSSPSFTRPPPTLYGILAARAVVAFVTYDAVKPAPPMRSVALFDLAKTGQDVWNAFALALLVCGARDAMMKVDAKGGFPEEKRKGKAKGSMVDGAEDDEDL